MALDYSHTLHLRPVHISNHAIYPHTVEVSEANRITSYLFDNGKNPFE